MTANLLWPFVALAAIVALWDMIRRASRSWQATQIEERLEKCEHGLASASERSANALDKAISAEQAATHALGKVSTISPANRWSR